MGKCEDCVMEHGSLFDEEPAIHDAHQLAITLRCAGVLFKLQSKDMSKEGAALVSKLNRFLRMLDERAIEARFNNYDHRGAVVQVRDPNGSNLPL